MTMASRAGLWIVPDGRGGQWLTTEDACRQLSVDRKTINDWVRRSAHEPGFPHVDRPKRAHGQWWYQLGQLLEAERHTAIARRGRRRGA